MSANNWRRDYINIAPYIGGDGKNQFVRKGTKLMDFNDAKVIVGGKVFPAKTVEFNQEIGEFPSVDIHATLNPLLATKAPEPSTSLSIANVIFNPPATIVFWSDNTKTVVKCDYSIEPYDPEKGLAMAFAKKTLGNNKYEYYNIFLHWLKKWDKQHPDDEYNPMNMFE